ncbi:MAG: response regulator [Chloroflexota bacterium]|nr:response regulator [Chloroflexota bacterium]
MESSRSTILVIDDDAAIRSTIAEILGFEGYVVEQASDGAEGLRRLERIEPALVIIDMRMPFMDGWDFTRALKERGIAVPVLAVTAAHDAGKWALEIGACGYLAKPFDLVDLLNEVEKQMVVKN